MSTIVNRIATVFTASSGNVRAVMGEVAGGMQGINRAAMETSRNTGYLSNQFRALGTTIRYALAGQAVFGAIGLVQGLSNIQRQMAMITTLAPQMNFTGNSLRSFFDELQQGSIRSLTPVDQLGESTINLLSSVQLAPSQKGELASIVTDLGEAAQLAQTPVDEITKAATGMVQAFGMVPSRNNFNAILRDYITLIRRAPGGPAAGQQIIQQLAPLAAVSRLARVSPQQMFGLMTTALRFGGTPSTAGRGVQFLLQSLAAPHKQEAQALAQAGVTPEFVQRFGGVTAIRAIIRHAQGLGLQGGGILRRLPDEQLDELDTAGMTDLKSLGISGRGIEWLQQAIGRIHGVRAAVTLATQMQTGQGQGNFAEDIKAADRAFRGIGQEGQGIENQFRDFARQQPLRAAGIALHNMALQIPRALEGLLNPVGQQLTNLGVIAARHPGTTRHVMQGAAGFMAALGLARFFGIGRGGILGRLTGAPGSRFVQERAVEAAVDPARAGVLGGSPQNPMYVTVVGQLFGQGQGPAGPGGPVVGPGGGRIPWILGGTGAARFARGGLAAGVSAYAAMRLSDAVTPDARRNARHWWDRPFDLPHTLHRGADWIGGLFGGGGSSREDRQRAAIEQANQRSREIRQLNRTLAPFHRRDPLYGITQIYSQREQMIRGKAEVVLDVNLSTSQGIVRKRIHIPMDMFKYEGGRTPSARGQAGKTKANIP